MQHITILPSENHVYVDGVCQTVDCSTMDPVVHAVQWDTVAGAGVIEYINDQFASAANYKPNRPIASIAPYQQYIDAWAAASAPPPPPTLAQAQAAKIAVLRVSCTAQIMSGVTSSALGATHVYPTDPTSQLNLAGSVTASLLPSLATGWTTPFWCSDMSGNWSFMPHTAAQIQQVGQDVKAFVIIAQTKLAQLTSEVNAATTVAAVNSINW